MINIDTHFFLEARHDDFMTTIKERSWLANGTNHDAFRAVSNWVGLFDETFHFISVTIPKGENVINVTFPYSWLGVVL